MLKFLLICTFHPLRPRGRRSILVRPARLSAAIVRIIARGPGGRRALNAVSIHGTYPPVPEATELAETGVLPPAADRSAPHLHQFLCYFNVFRLSRFDALPTLVAGRICAVHYVSWTTVARRPGRRKGVLHESETIAKWHARR